MSGLRAVGVGLGSDGSPWIPPLRSYILTRKPTEQLLVWKHSWLIKASLPKKDTTNPQKEKTKTKVFRELFYIPSTSCQSAKSGAQLLREMPCADQQQLMSFVSRNNLQASSGKKTLLTL